MTSKSARKILRKYNWAMVKHQAGVSYAPSWLLRLWKKCTEAAVKD